MTWTKLSDDFSDECWTLSAEAKSLHLDGLVWSNRKLLDCRIPVDDLRRFKHYEAIPELLEQGYWRLDGDHYVIVHHAMHQREKAAVLKQQEVNKENRAKRGQKTPPGREHWIPKDAPTANDSSNDSCNEMDRTGQDRLNTGEETLSLKKTGHDTSVEPSGLNADWPVVSIPKEEPALAPEDYVF